MRRTATQQLERDASRAFGDLDLSVGFLYFYVGAATKISLLPVGFHGQLPSKEAVMPVTKPHH